MASARSVIPRARSLPAMQTRGSGSASDRGASRDRGESLRALAQALEDVEFPISRGDLLVAAPRVPAFSTAEGDVWTLADLLADVPVSMFTSPRHVAEVVQMRWQDFAASARPGAKGARAPSPAAVPPRDAATERALNAKAEWERGPRRPAAPGKR